MSKQYFRIMLGTAGCYTAQCVSGNYIGVDFNVPEDLSGKFPADWRQFNKTYIPVYLNYNPGKPKVTAGLACGTLWRVGYKIKAGDIILCPNGNGEYLIAEITGDYYYVPGSNLPHRRNVKWLPNTIRRDTMSIQLKNSSGCISTCSELTPFASEIESLLNGMIPTTTSTPSTPSKKQFLERELHPLFCTYLRNLDIYAKTIYHEKSKFSDKEQKWVHPDIVGVEFMDYNTDQTKNLLKVVDPKQQLRFYSYELKRRITSDNELKEYYFQALSNSSWAHYGYLVAFEIDESLFDEIKRLNNAFGIGVILLQPRDEDTKILFQARENDLDYHTIDKICGINDDFKTFIANAIKVLTAQKQYFAYELSVLEKSCDPTLEDTDIEQYCQDHNIPY